MKDKFPFNKVKLINSIINIELYDTTTKDKDLKDTEGLASVKKGKIFLNSEYSANRIKQMFLHEILHMLDDSPGVKSLTEVQVEILSMKLLHFMQNNRDIVEYLVKK